MEKQEILEEIKRLSGEVQRMTDGGYEKSTWNQNKNIASLYADLGNEEEAVKHYLKVLDVLKMEPIEERHSLFWYQDYFNTFSDMISDSESIPNLKELALSLGTKALDEFDYNYGVASEWVGHGCHHQFLTDKEVIEITNKGLDKLDLAKEKDIGSIFQSLQTLFANIHDKDSELKERCLTLIRACLEDDSLSDDDTKNFLKDWLKDQFNVTL